MLELTKKHTTDEFAEIHLHGVPSDRAEKILDRNRIIGKQE